MQKIEVRLKKGWTIVDCPMINKKRPMKECYTCPYYLATLMECDYKDKITLVLEEIREELEKATKKFGSFHNAHEGYAVLLEEVDELWDNVKLNQREPERLRKIREEAIQVSAMALRIIIDCCGSVGLPDKKYLKL